MAMTLPAANYISNNARTEGEAKQFFEDLLAGLKQVPGAGVAKQALTLSADSVTPALGAAQVLELDTESSAATDNCKNIVTTNLGTNSLVFVKIANNARTVTVWNSAGGDGQIVLKTGDDFTLASTNDFLVLWVNGTQLEEVMRWPQPPIVDHVTKTSNYTVLLSDRNKSIEATSGTWTLTLPPAATAGKGFTVPFKNSGPGIITIDGNSTETIDGNTTVPCYKGQSFVLVCDGANWHRFGYVEGFTTGDWKLSFKTVADIGFIMADDGSIGSATSGATTRANADTEGLYTVLWNGVSDTFATVTGGRGASAAADFAANKKITLTKTLGRVIAQRGTGAGLTARALGESLGSENAIVVSHTHSISDPGHNHTLGTGGNVLSDNGVGLGIGAGANVVQTSIANAVTGITVNSSGSSGTGANMQPTTFCNVMFKL